MTFDPLAHAKAQREHPEAFVTLHSIWRDATALSAIKSAGTMETLNATSQPLLKAAREAGDTVLFDMFKAASTQRKGELTNV